MAPRRSSRLSASQASKVGAATTDPEPLTKARTKARPLQNGNNRVQKKSKAKASAEPSFKVPDVPATPKRKRAANNAKAPPITPTPSMVGLLSSSYSIGDVDDATPPPISRLVEPHRAAATLVTPGGTQAVAYTQQEQDESPSKGLPRPTATTGSLLAQACDHLVTVDPKLKTLIDKHHCRIFAPDGLAEEIDPFRSLASGIMAQQVSGAAAKSIKNKFITLFKKGGANGVEPPRSGEFTGAELHFPSPAEVAQVEVPFLRQAGLSERKAEYIKGLAEKFTGGELSTQMLLTASDEEVMEKLIAVRGLGRWSVEMFSCFGLKRMDIFSTGDLGVQRGMAAFVGKDVNKLKAKGGKWKYMSEQDMIDIAAKFSPYRSLFMWYMWRVEDVDVDALQNNST